MSNVTKSGRLATAVLSANIPNALYIVPDIIKFVTINFCIVNTGLNTAKIRVAFSKAKVFEEVTLADYIEYDFTLGPSGVMERELIHASKGETIFFIADQEGVVVRVHGLEGIIVD